MIKENPFTIDPIRKKEEFVGRKNLISKVKDQLFNGQSCCIVGERKSGKTSFLNRMSNEFKEGGDMKFVLLDMQGLIHYSPEKILGRIANCADKNMSEEEMGYEEFENFIDGRRVILALDEISAIKGNRKIKSDFLEFLRYIANKFDVVYLIANEETLCEMEKMYPKASSPFFNIFISFYLDYFTEGESKELIQKGGEEFLKKYGEWIIEKAYYHPFLLQLICLTLFKYYRETEGNTESILLSTEAYIYKILESHFKYWYDKSSEEEKRILRKISLEEKKGILGKILPRRGRISKDEENTARDLQKRLLIYKSNSRYHLVSPFFKERARDDISRVFLDNMKNIAERMILKEEYLPPKFKAEDRKRRIIEFIKKAEKLCKSDGYCVGEFISFDQVLQDELNLILEDLRAYTSRIIQSQRTPPRLRPRPMNVFIQAPPGSGKSFLVKSFRKELAKCVKEDKNQFTILRNQLPFKEVNLANISSYSELVTFLDSVREVGECGRIPFVLFDEIDAEMPGFNFYQRMLMPMWDGAYLKEGVEKELPSVVFFFAGTPEGLRSKAKSSQYRAICFLKDIGNGFQRVIAFFPKIKASFFQKEIDIVESRTDWRKKRYNDLTSLAEKAAVPKFCDFFNRIDRFIFLPPITLYFEDRDDDSKLYFADHETIYFFVAMIRKTFPTVKKISKAALAFLCNNFFRSRREMERAIFLSRISNGSDTYSFESLPEELKSSLPQEKLKEWNHKFCGEIRIKIEENIQDSHGSHQDEISDNRQ